MSNNRNQSLAVVTTTEPIAETIEIIDIVPTIKFNQLKPLTELQCIEAKLPSTPKAKPRLGIASDREVVWAPANFSLTDGNILEGFCKSRKIRSYELLAAVAMAWFEANRETITIEADEYIVAEDTIDELDRKMAAVLRQQAAIKAKIEAMRSRATAEADDEDEATEAAPEA